MLFKNQFTSSKLQIQLLMLIVFPIPMFQVDSVRLLGIHLAVFLRRSLLQQVSGVESTFTRTGMGGYWVGTNRFTQGCQFVFFEMWK